MINITITLCGLCATAVAQDYNIIARQCYSRRIGAVFDHADVNAQSMCTCVVPMNIALLYKQIHMNLNLIHIKIDSAWQHSANEQMLALSSSAMHG